MAHDTKAHAPEPHAPEAPKLRPAVPLPAPNLAALGDDLKHIASHMTNRGEAATVRKAGELLTLIATTRTPAQ